MPVQHPLGDLRGIPNLLGEIPIHFLRDQGQPQSAWLAARSADQTLSEPVRQRALQFAREWK